jgi:hypothetical protein
VSDWLNGNEYNPLSQKLPGSLDRDRETVVGG